MYECQNCGGNLKFDIASQQMLCSHCNTTVDPYSVSKHHDTEENNDFDVTVFTCPQCAGEIISTDTSAAEFCSFCGASVILNSRLDKELKPVRIIPFKKTKEACKTAYAKLMSRALFAPKELKDAKYIDSFRGIYIPYWDYHVIQKGHIAVNGTDSHRNGDYIYTNHYHLTGDLDAHYNGMHYDASSSFSDNISDRIVPFDTTEAKPFTPAFLSGFYADTADVSGKVYQTDAIDFANKETLDQLKKEKAFAGVSFSSNNGSRQLHTGYALPERVIYPVWFMSYRKKDRVAYACVNGQTGKATADIPIDTKKYLLGTILLAIPLFLLLNLFFTLRPTTTLIISIFLSVLTLIFYIGEINSIIRKEQRQDDKGYLYKNTSLKTGIKRGAFKKNFNLSDFQSYAKTGWLVNLPGYVGALVAIVIAIIILVSNPVSDIWYYSGALICFAAVAGTMVALIQKYNMLATRPLPQFARKGGDDRG